MTLTFNDLHDAEPIPWRAPKRPDPTQDDLKLEALAKLYAEADRAVQERAGRVSREEFARLTARRLEARNELHEFAHGYRRGRR